MIVYHFEFVVAGINLENYDEIDRINEELNSGDQEFDLHFANGLAFAEFTWPGSGAFDTLCEAKRRLALAAPDLKVARLHRRLVGIADIASEIGQTDEAARLISLGQRRHDPRDPFPNPVDVLRGGRRIWEWAGVCAWFQAHGDLLDEPTPIDDETTSLFNAHLISDHAVPKAPTLLNASHPLLTIRESVELSAVIRVVYENSIESDLGGLGAAYRDPLLPADRYR